MQNKYLKDRKMKYYTFIIALFGFLAFSQLAGCGKGQEAAAPQGLQKLANVSPDKAEQLALDQVQGKILEKNIELENGLLVYSYDIQTTDSTIREVLINAKNGNVVEDTVESRKQEKAEKQEAGEQENEGRTMEEQKSQEPLEEYQYGAGNQKMERGVTGGEEGKITGSLPVDTTAVAKPAPKISEKEAQTSALQLVEGKVTGTMLEQVDGYLVYRVMLKYKGSNYRVLVDAGNGKVLQIATV